MKVSGNRLSYSIELIKIRFLLKIKESTGRNLMECNQVFVSHCSPFRYVRPRATALYTLLDSLPSEFCTEYYRSHEYRTEAILRTLLNSNVTISRSCYLDQGKLCLTVTVVFFHNICGPR